jgi:hypothetical protein
MYSLGMYAVSLYRPVYLVYAPIAGKLGEAFEAAGVPYAKVLGESLATILMGITLLLFVRLLRATIKYSVHLLDWIVWVGVVWDVLLGYGHFSFSIERSLQHLYDHIPNEFFWGVVCGALLWGLLREAIGMRVPPPKPVRDPSPEPSHGERHRSVLRNKPKQPAEGQQ